MAIICEIVKEVAVMRTIVRLQQEVWGADAVTSMPQLVAATHHGGAVIAAFDGSRIVGFCYGFPGFRTGKPYLFSHMMAVDPGYRDAGLGKALKLKQREWAVSFGYDKIAWTYDPLETRNGYLNLNKLGGRVNVYLPDYYGPMEDPLNAGLPTDRFLVEWDLLSSRCLRAVESDGVSSEPVHWSDYTRLFEWEAEGEFPSPMPAKTNKAVEGAAAKEQPDFWAFGEADESVPPPTLTSAGYLVPVPAAIGEMKRREPELARRWRYALRRCMTLAFQQGYTVTGLRRTGLPAHEYVLEKVGKQLQSDIGLYGLIGKGVTHA